MQLNVNNIIQTDMGAGSSYHVIEYQTSYIYTLDAFSCDIFSVFMQTDVHQEDDTTSQEEDSCQS